MHCMGAVMHCMVCTNRLDKCRCTEDALNESQAEFARLTAEVERWKNTVTEMLNAIENDPAHIRDTAWNDAINEVSGLESWRDNSGNEWVSMEDIRALYRPT